MGAKLEFGCIFENWAHCSGTAKETGVDPQQYFVYALSEAAKLRADGKPEKIAKLTPEYFQYLTKPESDRGQV